MDRAKTKTYVWKNVAWVGVFLLAATISFLFLYRLDFVPVHLNQDELGYALHAFQISRNFHDYNGYFMPFYFWHLGQIWATPVVVYQAAIFLRFLPFSESYIRVAPALTGVFIVFMTSIVSYKLTQSKLVGLLTGMLTGLTPVLFINSRLLLDNIYTIPFVLLWLFFLIRYDKKRSYLSLLFAGLALGVGVHSYHAAKIVMPLMFILSFIVLGRKKVFSKESFLLALGFSVPMVLFIPWLLVHPDTLLNQVSYIGSLDKSISVDKGLLGVFNLQRLGLFITNYFSYLGPKILFLEGDRSLIHSTGMVGAFLLPTSVLLMFGILSVLFKEKSKFSYLVLAGFFLYPFAPSIVNDSQRISRGLVSVPFVMLLSAYGIKYLIDSKEKMYHFLLYLIIVGSLVQYNFFIQDYFSGYRARSYNWFNYDIHEAISKTVSLQKELGGEVYIDSNIPFVNLYYDFYKQSDGLGDIKITYFEYKDTTNEDIDSGALVLVRYDHTDNVEKLNKVGVVNEPDGFESYYIYIKE